MLLENDEGKSDPVSAEFLRTLFQNKKTLRLAVLNACEGARTDPTDPFAGVAQSLVRGGVAAVIAMQFEISDEAAIILSSEFCSALADGYPVDAALAEARTAVYTRSSAVEWAIPVLYLRSPDGSIFDVKVTPPVPRRGWRKWLPWPKRLSNDGPKGDRRRRTILVSAAALALVATIAVIAIPSDGPPPPPPPGESLRDSIVYVHEGEIRVLSMTTGEPGEDRALADVGASDYGPSVSPDGNRVAFGGGAHPTTTTSS